MEAQEEVIMGSNDLSHIIKRKRTKRQRALSPLPLAMNNTTSSSSAGVDGGGGGGGGEDDCNFPSPTTSSTELFAGHESTEEEEDMANCLILLAQGHGRKNSGGGGTMERFSSRKFTEATTTTSGKAGFYVYECKTCNRCFPSFQALGGHRASHKKPKAAMMEENKKSSSVSVLMALSPDQEDETQFNTSSCPLSLQMNNNNKSRVHECSICGSEFSSGQALGGHMRRHRSSVGTATNNRSITMTTTMTPALESPDDDEVHKPRNVLQLDLNLPAPSEEESKFSFTSKQQQPPPSALVFSASALVDCHY